MEIENNQRELALNREIVLKNALGLLRFELSHGRFHEVMQ